MRLLISICVFFIGLIIWVDYTESKYRYLLPKGFEKAKNTDTLTCIKDGNLIIIRFKTSNK